MSDLKKPEKACRFRAFLNEDFWEGIPYLRCWKGRFDDKYGKTKFRWQGIWRPNRTVAAAQKECPYFKVHPGKTYQQERETLARVSFTLTKTSYCEPTIEWD